MAVIGPVVGWHGLAVAGGGSAQLVAVIGAHLVALVEPVAVALAAWWRWRAGRIV